jgi:hypothetical protein
MFYSNLLLKLCSLQSYWIMFWRYQKGNQQPQIEDEQTTQDQQKWEKKTYNDLQNTAQKTTDWETRTSQKIDELGCFGGWNSSCSISGIRRVTVKRHEHHEIWKSRWTATCVNKSKRNTINCIRKKQSTL